MDKFFANKKDTSANILVQIPSYCDPELKNTVLSLKGMAAFPDRIKIAVCYQDDDAELLEWLFSVPGIKVKHYPSSEAPGTCAARYDCNKMLTDEDYVLHIDSHMRFSKNWDLTLLDQFRKCNDEKAILTGYCQNYDKYSDEPWDSPVFTDNALKKIITLIPEGYKRDAVTPLIGNVYRNCSDSFPVRGAIASGHFLFARSEVDRIVPFDPHMYFVGDELPMALRYFTHGYNLYHPGVNCVWHLYARPSVPKDRGNRHLWPENTEGRNTLKFWIEKKRIMKLYGLEDNDQNLSGFDLGNNRTLKEFEDFSGISFKERKIADFALKGDFSHTH